MPVPLMSTRHGQMEWVYSSKTIPNPVQAGEAHAPYGSTSTADFWRFCLLDFFPELSPKTNPFLV